MVLDLFFESSIVIEQCFEFFLEDFFLPVDPRCISEVSSSVINDAGDFGVV